MKSEDIKQAFSEIEPTREQTQRMWEGIAAKQPQRRRQPLLRMALPAFALAAALLAGGIYYASKDREQPQTLLPENGTTNSAAAPPADAMGGDKAAGETAVDRQGAQQEGEMAWAQHIFSLDGRQYYLLDSQTAAAFGWKQAVDAADIGTKLGTVRMGAPDGKPLSCEVFRYKPAGCDAVVAAAQGEGYQLYRFVAFESYNQNKDQPAADYLELYGIRKAADLAKIQVIGYSEQAKLENRVDIHKEITDRATLRRFYDYYSVIPDGSAAYFQKLFGNTPSDPGTVTGYSDPATPPDRLPQRDVIEPMTERSETSLPPDAALGHDAPLTNAADLPADYGTDSVTAASGAVPPIPAPDLPDTNNASDTPAVMPGYDPGGSAGSSSSNPGSAENLFADSVTLRIFGQNGLYFETVYYPHMAFLSRHAVNAAFADFLAELLA